MMSVGLGVRPFLLIVGRCRRRLIVDELQHSVVNELLQWLVVDIGMGDLPLLIGTEMKDLASGKGNANWCVGLVADRLHSESS